MAGHSRSKNGVASLAYSRSKNGVASLAYVAGYMIASSEFLRSVTSIRPG
jgi:hypothetical protein